MPEPEGVLSKDITEEDFLRFRDLIHRRAGIYLEEQKSDSLRISLVTRATLYGFLTFEEYFRFLSADDQEFKELLNLVTINETSFFRFPQQFDALRDQIIPEILESKPNSSRIFRGWSAGCSTGEEPYTLAMTLLDSGLEGFGYQGRVLGTDVSTKALGRAREAIYPAKALVNLPRPTVQRYFEAVKGGHRVVKRVRDIVDLEYHNLIKEPYPLALMSNWDVIFCRNVTIYFRTESTRRVVHNFFDSLNPGGYLFIGHSETLTSISDEFEPVEVAGLFLYRKPRPRKVFTFDEVVATRERAKPRARDDDSGPRQRPRRSPGTRPSEGLPAEEPVAAADIADLLDSAHELLDSGEPAAAIEVVDRVLRAQPTNIEARLVSAFAHADVGDFEQAASDAQRALKVNPLLASARYILGVIYQRQGELETAETELKRTLYIDRDFVLAHFNLANLYRGQGRLDDACHEYENTLRALYVSPDGPWTAFLGGFRPDLLAQTCERSLVECRKGKTAG